MKSWPYLARSQNIGSPTLYSSGLKSMDIKRYNIHTCFLMIASNDCFAQKKETTVQNHLMTKAIELIVILRRKLALSVKKAGICTVWLKEAASAWCAIDFTRYTPPLIQL